MKRTGPLAKPRTSPYRCPEFYWRGGDVLREKEYLTDEFRKALSAYRKAESDLKQIQSKVQSASEILNERDGYTTALAGYLDGDTQGFTEENRLKEEVFQLKKEVEEVEQELQKKRAHHNPAYSCALQKDKAYYVIEIERQNKAIENCGEHIEKSREALAKIAITAKYQTGLLTEWKQHRVSVKRKFLRGLVTQSKASFDGRVPLPPVYGNEARYARIAMQTGIDKRLKYGKMQERDERRRQKHPEYRNFLIEQIEELNTRLMEIGGENEELVDAKALREEMLPPEEEKVEVTKPRLRKKETTEPITEATEPITEATEPITETAEPTTEAADGATEEEEGKVEIDVVAETADQLAGAVAGQI
jgi:hypothetical protein